MNRLELAHQLGDSNRQLAFAASQLRLTRTALRDMVNMAHEIRTEDNMKLHRTTRWKQHMPFGVALANAEQILRPKDSDLVERMRQIEVTPLTT